MKKFFILMMTFVFILGFYSKKIINAEENNINSLENVELSINSPSAILMEFSTGKILYSKDATKKMYPASMTKMMAIYLFLESINQGTHSFDETVRVSTLASSMGGSQIFLKENEKMSFEDLFKAVTIASANDAVTALAEHTYGSISTFVNEMNARCKKFGMDGTNFVNVTGFHDSNHYTTALDMAILARKLLIDYGTTLLKYTSIYDTYLREDTSSPFWLVNTNRMLKYYEGMDGLKTGYTSDSGFNLTATAKRNDMRLISVVMGGETSKLRNADTSTLLNYGFNNYKLINLYKANETILRTTFLNAKSEDDEITSKTDVNVLLPKNNDLKSITITTNILENEAPKSIDEKVGAIEIKNSNNEILATYDLYPKNNIERLSFFDIFIRLLKKVF